MFNASDGSKPEPPQYNSLYPPEGKVSSSISDPAYPPPPSYPPPTSPLPVPAPQSPVFGLGNNRVDVEEQFNTNSFSDAAVRRGFIRRVYLLLFAMLMFTFAIVMVFTLVQPISTFVRKNPAFFYSSFGVLFLVFLLIFFIKDTYRRKHPWNLVLLGVFTLAFTYMAATLSSFFTTDSVIVAAAMTAAICLSITLFSIQTKIDFTLCSSLIFCVCLVLLYFAIACLVLRFGMVNGRVLDALYGGAFTLVMSLVLVIDTQQIVGGKRLEMNPEEYVFGALILYIDVIYIFILLLAAFGKSD
ncbi:protein lifeguard 1-like [Dreissena polymorpha]|uniref:Uncharacterized protein n=1 Tax=Dreissena polymorpha TaxID=45954 RepID=A0A9D4BDT4_DREPO|nr:protein lifeguard 1-like [Dreissena polymorpha]KAH3691060.1 hypothetical protein DPMN_193660 [Dreissena polymorpha]